MKSLLVTSTAKNACKELVFIAERADDEELFNTCIKTIIYLCRKFNITVFGSLPDYCNRSVPGGAGIAGGLGTDVK